MNVAVITGGDFRPDVSHESARRACAALAEAGHKATAVEADEDLANRLRGDKPDMVLSTLFGDAVVDGSVPDLMSMLEVPCIGSSAFVCRTASDKTAVAHTMEAYREITGEEASVAWPAGVVLTRRAWRQMGADVDVAAVADRVPGGFPVCVKPATGFMGRGVFRAGGPDELAECLDKAFEVCPRVCVQQWVDGLELAVCVVGSGWDAQALPVVEVHPKSAGFFNAASHENIGTVEMHAPVRLESLSDDESEAQAIRAEVERAALEAYRAFGVRDAGRVQMRWDGAQAQLLSIDVAPDFSASSIFSFAVAASGQSLADVLGYIVENRG